MFPASRMGILADDLTGACDAAAAFASRAGAVSVHILPFRNITVGGRTGLSVINMQSRLFGPAKSRRRAARSARLLGRAAVVYVKTDSVLRGPVGAELEGVASVFAGRRLFLIPAVPAMGKTTRGGCLFERGVPAHLTEYREDPVSPLLTNDIRRIVEGTGRVELEIPDAETFQDIEQAVSEALTDENVILAGSLGLADALACHMEPGPQEPRSYGAESAGRTMIVCGSAYPAAIGQLRHAAAVLGGNVISLGEDTAVREVLRESARESIVFVQIETGLLLRTWGTSERHLLRLFRNVERVVRACEPGGLGIVGGETAFRLLRRLGTARLEVTGRTQPGLAYGIIADGALAGRPFATKGGSVGGLDSCVLMVERLRRRGKDLA